MMTAQEFSDNILDVTVECIDDPSNLEKRLSCKVTDQIFITIMIEFAKMHVKAQQEAICKKAKAHNGGTYNNGECLVSKPAYIDKDSILNAYPLENIK